MNYNPYAAGPNETLSNELDRDTIHQIGLMKCKATGATLPNFTIFMVGIQTINPYGWFYFNGEYSS